MERKIITILAILFTCSIFTQTLVKKSLGDFSTLKIYNGIEVTLVKSQEQKIEIKG